MTDCPNIECRQRQDGHHTTLYGTSGRGGIVSCVGKMVSRAFLMWCAAGLLGLFGVVYEVYSRGQDKQIEHIDATFCTKDQYHEVNGEIIKLQADLEHVKKTTDELKTNSNMVLEILKTIERRDKDAGDD